MLQRIRHATDGALRRNAGDSSHGSANGCLLRVRNTYAHPLAPPTRPVVDQSGGAPATSGGTPTANGDSEKELRSDHSSGCQSIRELRRSYLSDAEGQRRTEQLRRREAATALETKMRRRRPERKQHGRVIKSGPTHFTEASREGN